MNLIDYDSFEKTDLLKIMKQIPLELEKRDKTLKKEIRIKMQKLAEQAGYSIEDILTETKVKPTKKAAPKYCDPTDSSRTWSGRGRKPLWVVAALESGSSLDELKIA